MLRACLLTLLAALLLFAQAPRERVDGVGPQSSAERAVADDCCPTRSGEPDPKVDCCDYDFGRCCANGLIALFPAPRELAIRRSSSDQDRSDLPPDRLFVRATGPPPTPPPIA